MQEIHDSHWKYDSANTYGSNEHIHHHYFGEQVNILERVLFQGLQEYSVNSVILKKTKQNKKWGSTHLIKKNESTQREHITLSNSKTTYWNLVSEAALLRWYSPKPRTIYPLRCAQKKFTNSLISITKTSIYTPMSPVI